MSDKEFKIDVNIETIAAGVSIAMGLVKSGYEIYEMIQQKGSMTEQDYLDIIERQDAAQAEAKAKLQSLREKSAEQPA